MFRKLIVLGVLSSLLTACSSMGAYIPGIFYNVQLPEAQPSTVCLEFARELSATMSLRIVDHALPTRPKGECIADLDNQGQSPAVLISILWDPGDRKFVIRVSDTSRHNNPASTRDLATQIAASAQKKFPDAVITTFRPRYGLLGP